MGLQVRISDVFINVRLLFYDISAVFLNIINTLILGCDQVGPYRAPIMSDKSKLALKIGAGAVALCVPDKDVPLGTRLL